HAHLVDLGEADGVVEAVGLDGAEVLAVDEQLAAAAGAGLVVLLDHLHPASVAIFLGEVRPLGGEDVRVEVDFEHAGALYRATEVADDDAPLLQPWPSCHVPWSRGGDLGVFGGDWREAPRS